MTPSPGATPSATAQDTSRWIDLPGVVNMRDLGGLRTTDGERLPTGRLIRSDNLGDLDASAIDALVDDFGVTDVIDLRSHEERRLEGHGALHGRGPTHHALSLLPDDRPRVERDPLLLGDAHTPERGVEFWSNHYLGYLSKRPDSVSAALRAIARAPGAVVVHCAAGKDRTGTIVALALDVAGVVHDEIVADYVLSTTRISAIIGRLRDRPAYAALRHRPAAEETPRAQTMETILATLRERHGDAAGWLIDRGWTRGDIDRLRAKLRF